MSAPRLSCDRLPLGRDRHPDRYPVRPRAGRSSRYQTRHRRRGGLTDAPFPPEPGQTGYAANMRYRGEVAFAVVLQRYRGALGRHRRGQLQRRAQHHRARRRRRGVLKGRHDARIRLAVPYANRAPPEAIEWRRPMKSRSLSAPSCWRASRPHRRHGSKDPKTSRIGTELDRGCRSRSLDPADGPSPRDQRLRRLYFGDQRLSPAARLCDAEPG